MTKKQALDSFLADLDEEIKTMSREQLLEAQSTLIQLKSTYEIELDEIDIVLKIRRAFDSGKITEQELEKIMAEREEIIKDLGVSPFED